MNKVLMAAAVAAAFVAGPASAEMYLGAGVGAAKTDSHNTSWKLYGGAQLSPFFGLEVGYTDLGNYRGSRVESGSLAATGTMPLDPHWSLLGKLGATSNRSHFGQASNHTDMLVGVGVGYSMTKNVSARLEYEDFGKLSKASNGNDSRGRNLGVSLKYGF